MKQKYPVYFKPLVAGLCLMAFVASCKKDNQPNPNPIAKPTNFATLGLYEYASGTNRRVYIPITAVGGVTLTPGYLSVFDTGSTGMTIDANGILPASMITSSGITVAPADSVVYNGITITSQTAIISYGGVGGVTQEYGNLAYATVKIGDSNGNITTSRIPFFLYYKAVDQTTGKSLSAHSNDVFGVGPGVSFTSNKIGSPLSYFQLPGGVASGFRLAMFNSASFSTTAPTYVAGLVTIGLTPDDISASGFIMHPLTFYSVGGYSPDIAGTINYNGTNVPATILLDTGTPSVSILENSAAGANSTTLPANTSVTMTTPQGFNFQYTTTSTYNLTEVDRPSYSQDIRTIFSIDFFLSNEYLLNYRDHQIGLKNN